MKSHRRKHERNLRTLMSWTVTVHQKREVPQLLHAYFVTVSTANLLLVKTGFSAPCASNGPIKNAVAMKKKKTISSVIFALARPDVTTNIDHIILAKTSSMWARGPRRGFTGYDETMHSIVQVADSVMRHTPPCFLRTGFDSRWGRTPKFSYLGIVPDDAACRRVFSKISRFIRPCNPALLHTSLASPSSALKTSMLRAARISSLARSYNRTRRSVSVWVGWLTVLQTSLDHNPYYGTRYLLPCKSAIGSESSRACLINWDPFAKSTSVCTCLTSILSSNESAKFSYPYPYVFKRRRICRPDSSFDGVWHDVEESILRQAHAVQAPWSAGSLWMWCHGSAAARRHIRRSSLTAKSFWQHSTGTYAAAGMKGRGNGRSPRKPGTFPTWENPGVARPGINPGSPLWEASRLTAHPPQPLLLIGASDIPNDVGSKRVVERTPFKTTQHFPMNTCPKVYSFRATELPTLYHT
ncbi:hypothetical protein PR048_024768 [Dryococelus australis]|uniref:Uncharacterized protein n=1 Tax=Dryococelus australis TaxID=614101 RepID=A0ABQ9GPF8_9NEOP|nr:hypothetical protein PR048_024768 [Dryococelus australis]